MEKLLLLSAAFNAVLILIVAVTRGELNEARERKERYSARVQELTDRVWDAEARYGHTEQHLWEMTKFIGALAAGEKGVPPTLQDPGEDGPRSFVMDNDYEAAVEAARQKAGLT